MISGTIPSFLGARPIRDFAELSDLNAVIAGLPWEGSNTWGSYSGCEQTPKACRLASLRYGTGYLPEYDVEVMTSLSVGDLGDFPTHPTDVEKTFASFEQAAASIFAAGPVPIFLGGDHSATYPVLKALTEQRPKRVGLIHFDAHMDNADEYAGDRLARCCPLRRIAELPGIEPGKIVHIGIRGPRNSPSQVRYAREHGMPLFTMGDIRRQGLQTVLSRAQEIAEQGTDGYYVTVCSDIMDHAFNPGGALDFAGLSSADMCEALFGLAQGKMLGFDMVEVYPRSDVGEASIHLMAWLVIYVLAGLAVRLRSSR
jgi:agmatinase